MRHVDYQSPREPGELDRAAHFQKWATTGGAIWDVVTPVLCLCGGILLYLTDYDAAWARLGGAAVVATSVAIAAKLCIEIVVTIGLVFLVARRMGFYLGEIVVAAVKFASAVVLCDAAATWAAKLFATPDRSWNSYIAAAAFVSFWGFMLVCFVLFRLNRDSYQAGPVMGAIFFVINLILLYYFADQFREVGAFAARLAHLHIAANQVPFERPRTFWSQ